MSNNQEPTSPFFRTIMGYHNKLVAEKDLLLSDIQRMSESGNFVASDDIISSLDALSDIEAKLTTVRKHFGNNETAEIKNETEPKT